MGPCGPNYHEPGPYHDPTQRKSNEPSFKKVIESVPYVCVKAASNVVVVCRLHYINTLKQELNHTKAYEETSTDDKPVVNRYLNELPYKFAASVKERQDKLHTVHWLPKLHKSLYKARFIANSSFCTTTELSILLTSCITCVKSRVIRYYETVYERSWKTMFWSIETLAKFL